MRLASDLATGPAEGRRPCAAMMLTSRHGPAFACVLGSLAPLLFAGCSGDGGVTDPDPDLPAPAFTLAIEPSALDLALAGSGTVQIRITRTNFTGPISVSATGAPAGVMTEVTPSPITGDSATLTMHVSVAAAAGTYELTVTAQAQGLDTRTRTLQLRVDGSIGPSAFQAVSVSVGSSHTCALKEDGAAHCWGAGAAFDGGADRLDPTRVAGDLRFTSLAAGTGDTCGLDEDGAVHCWGRGQLEPARVADGLTFRRILRAYQQRATCGLATNDRVYCWIEAHGESLLFHLASCLLCGPMTPVAVSHGADFQEIALGFTHMCGLSDDEALCWGYNFPVLHAGAPTPVGGGHAFQNLASGRAHDCGITLDGRALCWGMNLEGQLGDGTIVARTSPVQVSGDGTFASVAGGDTYTCGLTPEGQAHCWGQGPLGSGSGSLAFGQGSSSVPGPVAGGIVFRQVSGRGAHLCGVAVDDSVYCWGLNSAGQLGDGTTETRRLPTPVGGTP